MSGKSYPEWDRMMNGELCNPDPIITLRMRRTREILQRYNSSSEDPAQRKRILEELFDQPLADDDLIIIQPPFYCDFGFNITVGKNFFANFDCVILDCGLVTIGDDVWFGPKVQIYTPSHPIDPTMRRKRIESAHPVVIGDTVWIGGGAIVLPGITIGENSVIGAGSVVTHDIPANVVAAGNPCRVLREISADES
ncbi:MAG: sugar O-acetyltransferase [Euryarchaeota archaeon]|nr:sugar O-acetyltransferase [Euryarchaeota archaeon]